jgi:hypothetical protein
LTLVTSAEAGTKFPSTGFGGSVVAVELPELDEQPVRQAAVTASPRMIA